MKTFVKKFFIHEIITIFFVLITVVQFVQADEFTPPYIYEATPVGFDTNSYSRSDNLYFEFETDENGTINYYGSCAGSLYTDASVGINSIYFDPLPEGEYTDCAISVTDEFANESDPLLLTPFTVDDTAPTISEITPIASPTTDKTPEYSFISDEDGTAYFAGDCYSLTNNVFVGSNTIEFIPLTDGLYDDCGLVVVDVVGNASSTLSITPFTVFAPPIISEVTSVLSPSSDSTPTYRFTTDEVGVITYGGACSSLTTNAVVGVNTIVLDALLDGIYSNCTITVTGADLQISNTINVTPFTIDKLVPIPDDAVYRWAKQFGGGVGTGGYDASVTTDALGNVYTTGSFIGTLDFDPGAGVANLTSAGSNDIYISKLDSDGNYVWAKRIGGGGYDVPQSIAIDSLGNVYTIGSFNPANGFFSETVDFDPGVGVANLTSLYTDIFISKLDSDGNYVWAKRIGGNSGDSGSSLAIDSLDNVYITGGFNGTVDFDPGAGVANLTSAGSNDIYISKLDSDGNYVWAKSIDHSSYSRPSVAIDSYANLYTIGSFSGTVDFDPGAGVANLTSLGGEDIFISKLDSDGNYIWAKTLGGEVDDFASSLVIDSLDNVYTTGLFNGTVDFDPGAGVANLTSAGNNNIYISKLDLDGNYVWAKSIIGNSNYYYGGPSLAVDTSHNVYMAGDFYFSKDFDPGVGIDIFIPTGGSGDIFISKLNSNGNYLWTKTIGGGGYDSVTSIAVDLSDNIYTAGFFQRETDFDPGVGVATMTPLGGFGQTVFVGTLSSYAFPFLTETTPISSPGSDTTPSYTFTTTKAGPITYGGSCSSSTTSATLGTNTITFNQLTAGTYSNCTITVDDSNTLTVSSFTITTPSIIPVVPGVVSIPVLVIPPPAQLILPTPKQIEPIIEKITPAPKEEKKKTISPIDSLLENIEKKNDTSEKQPPFSDTPPSEPLPNPQPEQPTTPKNSFTDTIAQPIQNSLSVLGTTLSTSFVSSIQVLSSLDTSAPALFQTVRDSAVIVGSALAVAPVVSSASGLAPLLDLPRLLAHLWNVLLTALGLRKKRKPWGTVYDSQTKQPLDPAYVTLTDMTGKEVASSLTDIDGRYGFVVPPGTYTLSAKKTNYTFPSKKLQGVFEDELYTSLYFGEQVTITEEGEIINKNIPLDQLAFDWNEFAKNEQHRLTYFKKRDVIFGKISQVLFIGGFLFSLIALFATPTLFQILVTLVYVIIFFVRRYDPKLKATGFISKTDGTPLPFAIIRLLSIATGQEIAHKVADKVGRYYAIVPNGTYNITIDEKTPDGSYIKHTLTRTVTITKGVLGEEVRV
jgi:hypothetical protein